MPAPDNLAFMSFCGFRSQTAHQLMQSGDNFVLIWSPVFINCSAQTNCGLLPNSIALGHCIIFM